MPSEFGTAAERRGALRRTLILLAVLALIGHDYPPPTLA